MTLRSLCVGTGSYLPARILSNDELAQRVVGLGVGGRGRADDEGRDALAARLVEDVGEVEPVPRQARPLDRVARADGHDEPLLGPTLPPARALDLPTP